METREQSRNKSAMAVNATKSKSIGDLGFGLGFEILGTAIEVAQKRMEALALYVGEALSTLSLFTH